MRVPAFLAAARAFLAVAIVAFSLSASLLVAPALALTLDEAEAQGLTGERLDGYVGIVTRTPSDELRAMVARVNAQRRENYIDIARRTEGATLTQIERLAAEKLIGRVPRGAYVQSPGGGWVRK